MPGIAFSENADNAVIHKLDSTMVALKTRLDGLKADYYILNEKMVELTNSYQSLDQLKKTKYLYNTACFFVIILLSLSVMFISVYLMFKKFVSHKYNLVDF